MRVAAPPAAQCKLRLRKHQMRGLHAQIATVASRRRAWRACPQYCVDSSTSVRLSTHSAFEARRRVFADELRLRCGSVGKRRVGTHACALGVRAHSACRRRRCNRRNQLVEKLDHLLRRRRDPALGEAQHKLARCTASAAIAAGLARRGAPRGRRVLGGVRAACERGSLHTERSRSAAEALLVDAIGRQRCRRTGPSHADAAVMLGCSEVPQARSAE